MSGREEQEEMYERYDDYRACYSHARSQAGIPDDALVEVISEEIEGVGYSISSQEIPESEAAKVWDDAMRELLVTTFRAGVAFGAASQESPDYPVGSMTIVLSPEAATDAVTGLIGGRLSIHFLVERP